jgi:hypothetical protein
MKKFARFLYSSLAAVTATTIAIFVTPSPQADPPELDCAGAAIRRRAPVREDRSPASLP